jgi:hypothetical protein
VDSTSGVTIELAVEDQDNKRFDTAPSTLRIGNVRLHGRQVHPVRIRPEQFNGAAAYLIKLNYELATTPGTPAMNWFEFGVELRTGSVIDAVPHHTSPTQPSMSYLVSDHLNLIPTNDTALRVPSPPTSSPVRSRSSSREDWSSPSTACSH